jgi:hypothetical protein
MKIGLCHPICFLSSTLITRSNIDQVISYLFRLTRNISFEKYSHRDYPWMKIKNSNPTYELIDVEKYKFDKTQVSKIKDLKSNSNHKVLLSRYY